MAKINVINATVWQILCLQIYIGALCINNYAMGLHNLGSQGVKLSPNESTDPLRTHFSCTGAERTLMECRRIGLQNQTNCSMVAGVKCPSECISCFVHGDEPEF